MFPLLSTPFGPLSPSIVLLGIAMTSACALFFVGLRPGISIWRVLALIILTSMAALLGGRLMHVLWEQPEVYLQNPSLIFSNLRGMVFYGALGLGFLTFSILNRFLIVSTQQPKSWDLAALSILQGLVWLRMSCFLEGCCWGTISDLPWAVQYFNPAAIMPWLGIPVHPVQLYEATGALILFLVFSFKVFFSKKPVKTGQVFVLSIFSYSILRFFTEFLRGDSLRGENLWLGLSTSQWISLALFFTTSFKILKDKRV